MITLTPEQAQQIEESLARISDKRNTHFAGDAQVVAGEALAIIQSARAQEQAEQEPVARVSGYYGGRCVVEPLNRATVLPTDMALYAAPVQQVTRADLKAAFKEGFERAADLYAPKAEQEPRELAPVLAGFDRSKYTDDQWDWCLEYERITDYEPLMCDFENGTHSFYEAAQASVQWYEDHTSDAHLRISRTVGKFDPENEVDYD